jgi:hypothetical protein
MAEQKILISIQVKTGKSNQQIKATTKSLDQLATTQKKVSTGSNEMRATSGLNNAILMETGRLASDASYGFTAIANNLSQLVNLFQSSKDATGSYASSLKSLFTVQAAFLVGVQLLITFGDDLYRKLLEIVKGSQLVKDTMADAGSMVESTAGNFEMYVKTLQDSNKSQEEQSEAIHLLNKEFPEYIQSLKDSDLTLQDVANQTEEAIRLTDLHREAIVKLAKSEAAKQKIQELSGEQTQAQIDLDSELRELNTTEAEALRLLEERTKLEEDLQGRFKEGTRGYQRQIELIERQYSLEQRQAMAALKRRDETVAARQEDIDSLIEFVDLEISESKRGAGGRNRAYKEGDLDFEKERQQSQEREIESFLQKELSKVNLEFQGIRDRARLKQEEFVEDEKRRLDAFLRRTKDENAKADAIKRSNEAIKNSEEELGLYLVRLNTEQAAKTTKVKLEADRKVIELDQKKTDTLVAHQDKLAFLDGKYTFDTLQRNIKRLESEISLEEQLSLNHEIGTEERAQADLKLANLRRELSSERIALEKQEFDFVREQIEKVAGALEQTLEVTAHNQTVRLEENYAREIAAAEGNSERQQELQQELAKKKDDIQRKQFNVDKAMKVGRALMDTYESSTLAYGSQIIIGDPTSIVRAQVARAVAIATGLANVANIARQKYQSSLGAGGGGGAGAGGGGLQIQAPDFNVVGASQTSQLAESVAGQQAKPVKAFVVGKDISSQQELDRNITNTASFG